MAHDWVHEERGEGLEIVVVATSDPGQVCARLKGVLDIAAVPVAGDRIADLVSPGCDLIIDLRGLSFIDSSGLNLLLRLAAESARDGWTLSLIPGSSVVQRVFQVTGTEKRLPFGGLHENGSTARASRR